MKMFDKNEGIFEKAFKALLKKLAYRICCTNSRFFKRFSEVLC